MRKLFDSLRGITGEYEIQRILGSFGSIVYIVTAPALVWAGIVQVTFESFCFAYPTGLGVCIGATAGAIALKDKFVARAKNDLAKTDSGSSIQNT